MAATPRENAALVRRFLTDVVAGGDTDALGAFLGDDAVDHNLVFGPGPSRSPATDLGWRVLAGATVEIDVESVVATDDRVAVQATVRGRHRESLLDLAPTGQTFEIANAWFCRIRDRRIVEIRSLPDGLGLLQQLGAIPDGWPHRSLPLHARHDQS